jgi:restriction system protein
VLFLLLVMWAIALVKNFTDAKRLDAQQSLDTIRTLPWREFELLLAEHFRRLGYHVEITPDGADGGIDLILQKDGRLTLVQAKQWRTERVGVTKVRELFGIQSARRAAESILITSGRFTPEARAFADESGVRLIDGEQLEPLILEWRRNNTKPRPAPAAPTAAPPRPAPTPAPPAEDLADPSCPKCGSPMAKRTARQGSRAGSQFWGCTKYPACKGTRDIG